MVLRLGMDERAGLRVFNPINVRSGSTPNAQKTFETIDGAINTILDECYSEAKRILEEKRDYVDRVAEELLEVETISKERFAEIMAA
jgi:ATP-dependent Zn protease